MSNNYPLYAECFNKLFQIKAMFPDTEDGTEQANNFCAENTNVAVLDIQFGMIIIASIEAEGA